MSEQKIQGQPPPSKLPILVERTPGRHLRWLHLILSAPLIVLASVAAYWGDETAGYVFALAAGISTLAEVIANRINRRFGRRYEINAKGVMCRAHREFWFEPMAAYTSVDWYEEVVSASHGGQSFVQWQARLRHRSKPSRSLTLFSAGESGGDKRNDRERWRAIAHTLGLPARQIAGPGVEIAEIPENPARLPKAATAPKARETETPEIGVRRSFWAWILPLWFTAMGIVILYQELSHQGLPRLLADFGPLLYGSGAVLAAFWVWALTNYRVQISPQAVSVQSRIGPFTYLRQTMERPDLREILVHHNRFGVASVSLQGERGPTVGITILSLREAQRVQRFVQNRVSP